MNTRDQRVEAILATALEKADPDVLRAYVEEACALPVRDLLEAARAQVRAKRR